jgi:DNA invertase Pin-like site-specific DNA recombinase
MKENVIIYARVSTDEQADNGFSLRHQTEMLEKYCEIKDYNIIKHYEEDFSAKNFNRPEWIKVESFVKANRRSIDKIIVTKWDRFSRNIEEALRIIRNFKNLGIEINAIEQPLDLSNPDNKTMLALYLVMPEVENDKISQRTKEGILRARKEGAYTSKPPFGYESCKIDDRASMVPSKDAPMVKKIFQEVANGVNSVEQIRRNYSKSGYKGCKQAFYNMLRSKLYIGLVLVPEYKKDPSYWVKGLHQSIIDDTTFYQVQNVLKGKKKNTRLPAKKHLLLPLRGHLKCPICEENLTGSVSKGNGGMYAYYHCRLSCSNRIPSNLAHELFYSNVFGIINVNSNVLGLFKEILSDKFKSKKGNKITILKEKSDEIINVERQINTIEDKLSNGSIDDDAFNRMNNRYIEKLMSLKAEYELLKNQKDEGFELLEEVVNSIKNLGNLFENGDYEMKTMLLGSILNGKVYISKNECRTTEMNRVVELISRINKDFKTVVHKKTVISDGLSTVAPPAGLEPATL